MSFVAEVKQKYALIQKNNTDYSVIFDNKLVFLEGFKKIVHIANDEIVCDFGVFDLAVIGENLSIVDATVDSVCVKGKIARLENNDHKM